MSGERCMTRAQRDAVVREALSWVGTPYRARQCVKGVGVDCGKLLAAVYANAGVMPMVDLGEYSFQQHLHSDAEDYMAWLESVGARRIEADQVMTGDAGVWKFGRSHSHGGIVVDVGADGPVICHSYIKAGRGVTLTRAYLDEPLAGSPSVVWWRYYP